ncbi:hypothetical protein [Dokdonella koreensis]|uniref:Uncharacterized protein n=1 Tax=Dokdonella koreensis DS-123 TaxID=1300342 RepID=A0A160DVG7_9GAMM|nr:hypothetical protein [Dokdonella koreensis]ANB18545.1 Hypothetical protein I596_2542 [Dokdonella koreensis DS-123]
MSARLIPALLIATGLLVLTIGISGMPHRPAAAHSAATIPAALPVLPTVLVRPDMEVMPEVVVQPTAEELAAANEEPGARGHASTLPASRDGLVGKVSLDMPYYSFGKTSPSRASVKE